MTLTKPLHLVDLVRDLRQHFSFYQEKFAAHLGVSYKTVNHWENEHTIPSPMALKLIENLLQQMGESGKALLSQHFSQPQ